jgi:3-isopropylmalate/(R)-2-methylmalate dehydratase small subunit
MEGTAYKFGDEVNTDVISPSEYHSEGLEVMAKHIFEPVRQDFAKNLDEDALIVAGNHFGSGSSRESAPASLKEAGVKAVIAESFSRIFYRNSITLGFPVSVCPGVTEAVDEGDKLRLDLENCLVANMTRDITLSCEPISPEIRNIFDAGGLVPYYRKNSEGL